MTKMRIYTFSLIFIFLLSSNNSLFAQEKVKLEYNFKAGDKLNYTVNIDGNVNVQVRQEGKAASPQNSAKMKGNFSYVQEIKNVNPQDKTIEIQINYGKSKMETIIGEQVIPNADVNALEGKSAILSLAKNGEVKSFKLPEQLPASMQNADFRNMFAVFPEKELRIGESWLRDAESKDEENELFSTQYVTHAKYTLSGIEKKGAHNCAKVQLESTTQSFSKPKSADLNLGGTVDGKVSGVIFYDLTSGYVVYSDLETKIINEVTTQGKVEAESQSAIKTLIQTSLRTVTQLE